MKRAQLEVGGVYAWRVGKYGGCTPAIVLDDAFGYGNGWAESFYRFTDWRVHRARSVKRVLVAVGLELTTSDGVPRGEKREGYVDGFGWGSAGPWSLEVGGRLWMPCAALPAQLRSTWADHVAAEQERERQEIAAREISRRAEEARRAQQEVEREAREAQRQVDLARRNRIRASNDELLEKRILPTLEDVVGRDLRPNGDAHDSITLTLDDLQRLVSRLEVEA